MWIKNAWYVAAFENELSRELVARQIIEQKLVFFRTEAGTAVALEDRCPHRGIPLSKGTLTGDAVRCTYHGIRIASDGSCVHIPCQAHIPSQAKVRAFPVVERFGMVWVWMGDEPADVEKIPDFHWMKDEEWAACNGYHLVKANYQFMNDNLLDLSHEAYVHERTIGNEAVAEAPVTTTSTDGEVRVHRDIENCEPPPFYKRATGFETNINRWHTTIFRPPGFHVIENGSYPVTGTKTDALERRVMHLVTPETPTTSHYFWGVARQYLREDSELTEYIRQQSSNTFDEDAEILEIQQQAMHGNAASSFPVALKTDAGPIRARRMIQSIIEAEQRRGTAEV
ncbi:MULTISPECIES: aromatic ring-hydroxylating dioxygenase subunit alpha [Burkholderiaceae]|uniref:aromatic ring-hydroxylating dioxygenase subunit alpha n=1 Tax=Burkholderiaceae TaxID=119060 RepID=UPI00141F820F|nr:MULTISPECIES: aromatic ring-hydroxylating dioxygenase subunit alpha [Burkholderiaceae]MBN3851139.1 aromatic ring-hydroxylating dioxygenase subunit alpha [Paraburkholderia sp. Ac-20342]NIF51259.1 aromatic ring-hydroxylating dioxygenase subunit alpha [Burkholderia sp. Ax-1724]